MKENLYWEVKSISDDRAVQLLPDKSMDEWIDTQFQKLKKGDIFKLFEPNGQPVIDMLGFTILEATSDPYLNEENEWQIDTN